MGRLVQQAPPARTDRQRPSRRGGSAVLCPGRGTGLGRLTQAKPPPKKPGTVQGAGRPVRGTIGKDIVSRAWRKVATDWQAWNRRDLSAEPVVRLILDG